MGRKITMTGRNARYVEHRGVNATPDNDREIRMEGEDAGMQSNDVTDLVNRWVEDKRISDYGNSRKGALWVILHKAGLYTKSRQNWCRRVY
jgi:hypothetical protein